MKSKLFLTILIIINTLYSFSQRKDDQNSKILDVAKSGLKEWLEKIPNGKEAWYGFTSREEFAGATLGDPYEVLLLSNDFFKDSILEEKNYFIKSGEWKVPISINGECRSFLKVGLMNGALKVVGLGSSGLAKEVGDFKKLYLGYEDIMLLRVYQLECDFIIVGAMQLLTQVKVYPLKSANIESEGKEIISYSLPQLLSLIKKNNNKIK